MVKQALFLSGGGARGAYQAGVLKAINHIIKPKACPFDMISGVSVGSMNGAIMAEHADDFATGVERLESIWTETHCDQIFDTSNYSLFKSVLRNMNALFIKQKDAGYLLDTKPMHESIKEFIDFSKIASNIIQGHLKTFEVITNCYDTQQTISFYDHHYPTSEDWQYPRHSSVRTQISDIHLLASGAIPLFFPAVTIDDLNYGDGSIGLITPLRGAIRFKMDKILVVGTGHEHQEYQKPENIVRSQPGFAYVIGNILNSIFIDNLDHNIEMVNRMNEIARLLSMWKKRYSQWRPIETKYLRPSKELGLIAKDKFNAIPAFLRFLLNVLGNKNNSGDLVSFLLFEKNFTRELINLGFQDTMIQAGEIEAFFK